MSWQVIARTDVASTVRPRSVKLLLGLPVVTILFGAYIYPLVGSDPVTTARYAGTIAGWLTGVLALAGILLGYSAVVSERESGAILLSLSLPHSRRDLVFGRFAGRAGLLGAALVAALGVAGVLVVYPFGSFTPVRFAGFALLTVAFGALWVGLGVAASLAVASKRRAFALAAGLFFLFIFAWDGLVSILEWGLSEAGLVSGGEPAVIAFVRSLEPGSVFGRLVDGFVDPSASVGGPWYVGEWTALVVFLLWLVVPLGLAYLRFDGGDLT